jgi:GNAT superfamily N-acetyltransferase
MVAVSILGPFTAPDRLETLAPLWRQLHRHHLEVAAYAPLVDDLDQSWGRRRAWYQRLLSDGGAYLIAHDHDHAVAYAFLHIVAGLDDTFEVKNGIVEIVSLVVDQHARGQGVGTSLLHAIEALATTRGIDTLKVAVMAGNDRALAFYRAGAFARGEEILYRRLDD